MIKKRLLKFFVITLGMFIALLSSGIKCINFSDPKDSSASTTSTSPSIISSIVTLYGVMYATYSFSGRVIKNNTYVAEGIQGIQIEINPVNSEYYKFTTSSDNDGYWSITGYSGEIFGNSFLIRALDVDDQLNGLFLSSTTTADVTSVYYNEYRADNILLGLDEITEIIE